MVLFKKIVLKYIFSNKVKLFSLFAIFSIAVALLNSAYITRTIFQKMIFFDEMDAVVPDCIVTSRNFFINKSAFDEIRDDL